MRKKWPLLISLFLLVVVSIYVCVAYYSYVFAKNVIGEIVAVERITDNTAIITGRTVDASQLFSYAVAIRSKNGEIYTSSSEDRQWSVAQKGQCAEAKYFPYPPWDLDKGGTFYGARLVRLFDCSQVQPTQ
jgi:hypothetical protein